MRAKESPESLRQARPGAVAFTALGVAPVALAFGVVAVTAVVDLGVIQRRRKRGEPD